MSADEMPKKPKVYTSFHELSPGEYMYIPEGNLQVGRPGSFSRLELLHISIAMAVLTVAFSFTWSPVTRFNLHALLTALPISFLGILTAFFVHELAHKVVAQRYGLWSEFRMYPLGLLLSLLIGMFTGYVFAAPGAVMFRGETRSFEQGHIAAAGPVANIVCAVVTYPLSVWFFDASFAGISVGGILVFVCLVNSFLATFNLLPFRPLDGKKIFLWNSLAWSFLFTSALILVVLNFSRGIVIPGL
jgi:Zn-dependent protease